MIPAFALTWLPKIGGAVVSAAKVVLTYWRESLIVVLLVLVWMLRNETQDLEIKNMKLGDRVEALTELNIESGKNLERCIEVNRQNAKAREAEATRAREAEDQLQRLRTESEVAVAVADSEAEAIRQNNQDEECRLLTDELPQWFSDWVRATDE